MVQSARLPADTVSRGEVAAVRTAKETRARPFASGLERKAPRPWPRRKAPNTKVPAGVCGAPAGCRSGEPPADGCGNWHGHRTGHAERAVGAAIGARTRRCKLLHPTLYFFFFFLRKRRSICIVHRLHVHPWSCEIGHHGRLSFVVTSRA